MTTVITLFDDKKYFVENFVGKNVSHHINITRGRSTVSTIFFQILLYFKLKSNDEHNNNVIAKGYPKLILHKV